ncbi:MAG: hypothetical protein WAM60_02425, partial [Candidatus Promineifilaceae bacterium]
MKRWLIWPLLILAVGLLASALLGWGTNDPVVYMRASSSSAVLLLTVIVSVIVAAVLGWRQQQIQHEQMRLG